MALRFSVSLPTGGECGDPRFLLELAERAEAAGWDAIFLEDYVIYQGGLDTPTCDPWAALTAMALRTSSVVLGVAITPLSRRRPWQVARQAAAVDQLSGGRLVLGVGLGDAGDVGFGRFAEELDPRGRAERLDEALEILVGLWSGEPFSFRGKHFAIDEVTFLPTPVQRPRIPIWVGGGYPNRRPLERAARWDGSVMYKQGDGVNEAFMAPEDVRGLKAFVEERRGPETPYEISVGGNRRRPDWDEEREHIRGVAEGGATWWMEWIPPGDRESMREAVERGPLRM